LLQGITRVNGKLIGYHYELGFIRRFDFSSKLKRMSAVVENAKLELLLVILKVPQKQ
jgi:magnesium-transporting ATPase (P-type)